MIKEKIELVVGRAVCTNVDKMRIYCGLETPLYRLIEEERSVFYRGLVSVIVRK